MTQNGLMPLDLSGAAFEEFVAGEIAKTEQLSREIGILQ